MTRNDLYKTPLKRMFIIKDCHKYGIRHADGHVNGDTFVVPYTGKFRINQDCFAEESDAAQRVIEKLAAKRRSLFKQLIQVDLFLDQYLPENSEMRESLMLSSSSN